MIKEKYVFYVVYNKFKIFFGIYFVKKIFGEKVKVNVE